MPEVYSPAEDSYLMQEVLIKEIPNLIENKPELKFLEIGCGSGIQLQTVLESSVKKQNIFSVDINPDAIKICKQKGFKCIKSDLFENIKGKFNLIIFNPPYLPEDSKEPKDSRLATTGGKEGSEIINNFLEQAKDYLSKDGKIFLLTSSLTKGINWGSYEKKLLGKKKLFFEELYVWELEAP